KPFSFTWKDLALTISGLSLASGTSVQYAAVTPSGDASAPLGFTAILNASGTVTGSASFGKLSTPDFSLTLTDLSVLVQGTAGFDGSAPNIQLQTLQVSLGDLSTDPILAAILEAVFSLDLSNETISAATIVNTFSSNIVSAINDQLKNL